MFLPTYRGWVIVASVLVCLGTWFLIERTRLGAYLRAGTENPTLVRAFGINVPLMMTLTYGFGVALAGFAGVLAAPIYQVNPLMGSDLIIVVFAIVVIGGMGSILGSIVTGLGLGVIEGLTKVFYPEASSTVIFVIMAIVLLIRPAGLFGRTALMRVAAPATTRFRTPDPQLCPDRAADRARPGGAVRRLPDLPDEGAVLRAVRLRLQSAARLRRPALVRPRRVLRLGRLRHRHGVKAWGLPPELAILAGTAAAALLGLAFGWLAIRRTGIYFAMITLALAQMTYFFALQAPFTGGEDGLQPIPRGHLFGLLDLGQMLNMYYFTLGVFVFGFLLIYRAVHSPFGQVLKAIRENETRAVSLGYKVHQYKLLAFVLSAALSGLAGATKAIVFQFATLTDVHWHISGEVVLMTLLGGMGTIFGPVVGAFVVVTLQNYLAGFGGWVTVITGAIFVACVLLFRRGIVGELTRLSRFGGDANRS